MGQTTVQQADTIRFGSGVLEIGDDIGSLVNIGAFRSGKFDETFDEVTIKSDNAGVVYEGIANHEALLSCDLMEINLDTLASYLKGTHTVSTVAGAATPITDEAHVLTDTNAVRLDHKMGDGTEVGSIVVSVGATPAVRNTDYVVAVDPAGYTTIARVAASTVITDGATALVDYSYTPNASRTLKAGGLQQLTARVARFTNYNSAGEKFEITVWKATAASGISIEFLADDADDVDVTPISIKGTPDATRTLGEQLFTIVDEQHTT